ncbi:MAG: hypothetical protein WCI61_05940 [Chloroflexota bacterium]
MAGEKTTEALPCGCEWEMDYAVLATRCAVACPAHAKDRGRPGLLPKPLPAGFSIAEWVAQNVRR